MGMEFEKLKKKNPTDRPIPEKQGRVRGNKIFLRLVLAYFFIKTYVVGAH